MGTFTLGVVLPLFDQFQTRFDVERARSASRVSTIARGGCTSSGSSAMCGKRPTTIARQSRGCARPDTGLASAQEAFDAVSARFDVGLGIFLDVEAAQAALTVRAPQRAAAGVDLVLRKQVLRFVTGVPVLER